jgi:hypothetical protein
LLVKKFYKDAAFTRKNKISERRKEAGENIHDIAKNFADAFI